MFVSKKNEKKSQYRGVSWHKGRKKWYVVVCPKGQKQRYGGIFKDELDAAKRGNQLCEELGIPLQNPEISTVPNQKHQVITEFILSRDIVRKSRNI